MVFSRQEYWSRLPFPPLGDLLTQGQTRVSPALAGGFFTTRVTWEETRGEIGNSFKEITQGCVPPRGIPEPARGP